MGVRQLVAIGVGIAALGLTGTYVHDHLRPDARCQVCTRALHEQTLYRVTLKNGRIESICCPRCGLRFQKARTDVERADVVDFRTKKRIDAEKAFYVEASSTVMCRHDGRVEDDRSGAPYELTWDRCLPSLIAFSTRASAEVFRANNGGAVKTYDDLKQEPF